MCGRFNLRASPAEIQEFFDLFREPEWEPRYNIAPTQDVLAVRFDEAATPREAVLLRWGLIPPWARDLKARPQPINARADKVATSGLFRRAFQRRRCLVPASGFYEWQQRPGGKQPFHVHRADERPFAFAGLWERWEKGETPVESCAIITTDANDLLAPIHDRMPVILLPEDYDRWLDPSVDDRTLLESLLRPYPRPDLLAEAISTTVNNPRNEGPECLAPG